MTKELRRCQRHGNIDKSKLDAKACLTKLRKVAFNFRADLETFITAFVKREGLKDIMMLIEECQVLKEKEMVAVACSMLATLLAWGCAIDAIKKKAKKYFEKFFELSDVDENAKK